MYLKTRAPIAAILATTTLAACGGGGNGLRYSEADQIEALQTCATQLEIRLEMQRLASSSGPDTLFAVNANGVTLAQGRAINQCKSRTLAERYVPV